MPHDQDVTKPPLEPPRVTVDEPQSSPAPLVYHRHEAGGRSALQLKELWEYRELLWLLVRRDLAVRYREAVIGVLWAVLQPALAAALFTLVFGYFAGLRRESAHAPYPVLVFVALLPWQIVSRAITESSLSFLNQRSLMTKVYFPRIAIPLVPVLTACADFACALPVLLVMCLIFEVPLGASVSVLPAVVLLATVLAAGVGLWLATLAVVFPDSRHGLGLFLQLWMFASPVAYPLTIVPERVRGLLHLNPLTGVVELSRWCVLGGDFPLTFVASSALIGLVLLWGGGLLFRRAEAAIVDAL